jgi:hypothetical protein
MHPLRALREIDARLWWLVLVAWLVLAAPAVAAPFAPATPVAGIGDQPALALVNGASLATGGESVIAGTWDRANTRRAFAAFGDAGSAPTQARGFGPTSGAFDLAFAANTTGDVALTYTVGHVAYLTTCRAASCRPTVRVGTSAIKPQSAVAVQPSSGRTIVMWRDTSRRVRRAPLPRRGVRAADRSGARAIRERRLRRDGHGGRRWPGARDLGVGHRLIGDGAHGRVRRGR